MKGYRLVKGEFHLFYKKAKRQGSEPDGDSVWFKPANDALLSNLGGRSAHYNGGGCAQLRFEGIDCLELHYEKYHQDFKQALAARDFMLKRLGFRDVAYALNGLTVKSANPHPVPGYILTRGIDLYGRPVAFVVTGRTAKPDGATVVLNGADLKNTVNAQLATAGLAYPGYYDTLPTEMRGYLSGLSTKARQARKGLWPGDVSQKGAKVTSLADLEPLRLWPKLFRRLVDFWKSRPQGLAQFDAWLRADPEKRDDELWIISKGEIGNLHDVFQVKQGRIMMVYDPHDLVVRPR